MTEAKPSGDARKAITPVARLCFPSLFEPRSFEGSEPKYSCVLVFPPASAMSPQDQAAMQGLKSAAKAAVAEKWGDKPPKGVKSPFRACSEKEDVDGFNDGEVFITISSKDRPNVVDSNVQPILSAEDIYAGAKVRASVRAYAFDRNGNKGVSFGLDNIQKVGEGRRVGGGRRKAEDDFTPMSVENDPDADVSNKTEADASSFFD